MKGIDIIRDAYIQAITENIKDGNFAQIKILVDTLERFSTEFNTKPVNNAPVAKAEVVQENNLGGLFDENDDPDSAVTSADMREFIVAYVQKNGVSFSSDIYDAFGKTYANQFFPHDLDIVSDNTPRWRNRMYNVGSNMRSEGILMPHKFPFLFKCELTPTYRKLIAKKATA